MCTAGNIQWYFHDPRTQITSFPCLASIVASFESEFASSGHICPRNNAEQVGLSPPTLADSAAIEIANSIASLNITVATAYQESLGFQTRFVLPLICPMV